MTAANRFCRYELRTTDVDAARAFYSDVLSDVTSDVAGPDVWGPGISVVPLPQRAAAAGAPAHWLGHFGVSDVDRTADRIVATGGQQQMRSPGGPAGGSSFALLRDPFGAIIGLGLGLGLGLGSASSQPTPPPAGDAVVWRILQSPDHHRAFAWYAALFAWKAQEVVELGPAGAGSIQLFGWDESGRSAGCITSNVRVPDIHPSWLFCFRVADIEGAIAKVRARGGKVLESTRTSRGDVVAPCDDPQGAAFALYQFAD